MITGTLAQPILVRNYAGETARIRIGITQTGRHVHWKSVDYGLVLEGTSTNRISAQSGSNNPTDIDSWHAFTIDGDDVKLINVRIENVLGAGVIWFHNHTGEVYGLIAHDCGWDAPDDSHGPGFYSSKDSAATVQRFEHCFFANNWRSGFQLGDGGGNEDQRDYTAKNITVVGSAITGGSTYSDGSVIDGLWQYGGHVYFGLYSPAYFGDGANGSAQMVNSIIDPAADLNQFAFRAYKLTTFEVSDTLSTVATYVNDEVPDGTYSITVTPAHGQHVQVILNEYAPNFATLRVFDFTDAGSVDVDVSALANSGTLRVRNPMLWDEYQDLTITSGQVTLTLAGWTTPPANGLDTLLHTVFSSRFGCWIVEKR